MLSRDEEHELALLEESLQESAYTRVMRAVEGPVWRHRWKVRALFTFGILVWVCGGVTGSEELTGQGFLITTAVSAYWVAMFVRNRPERPPDSRPRHHRSPRQPGGW